MNDYAPPHIEYLESVTGDPEASPSRQELAQEMLMFGAPSPRFDLPRPATNPELIAAVMMVEAHLKAADLGVNLGERLVAVLYWAKEPEMRSLRLAQGGPGDPLAPKIAEAMLQAGRTAAQRLLGCAGDVDVALHKIESIPCPCCGRAFGPCGEQTGEQKRLRNSPAPTFSSF
jgi:hypothetical protein